jgi:hypothetical protein
VEEAAAAAAEVALPTLPLTAAAGGKKGGDKIYSKATKKQ